MKKILNSLIALCVIGFASSTKAEVQIVESLMMFKVNGVDTYRQGDRADWGTFFNPRLSIFLFPLIFILILNITYQWLKIKTGVKCCPLDFFKVISTF